MSENEPVKVLRYPVGLEPQVVEVKTFEDLRVQCGDERNVRPFIVRAKLHVGGATFDVWCDEDGDPKGLPLNQYIHGYPIRGTFVVALRLRSFADGPEAITGLTESEVTMVKTQLAEWRR